MSVSVNGWAAIVMRPSRSPAVPSLEHPPEILDVLAREARHLVLAAEVPSVTRGALVGDRQALPRRGFRRVHRLRPRTRWQGRVIRGQTRHVRIAQVRGEG